jgi:hypothetical protein
VAASIAVSNAELVAHALPSASAATTAAGNWNSNLRAVTVTQPRLADALRRERTPVRPVYARDGSLTTLRPDGKWWHGCSIPLRATGTMLAKLDVKGRVACLLRPTLSAHMQVALQRSRADQAIIALCPDLGDLHVLLQCVDLSADVRGHRLWFAWGDDCASELRRLLTERPGLATPAQFIRLPITPAEEVDRLVAAAQRVFAEINAARLETVSRRRDAWHGRGARRRRLCVVARSHFRLWDDAGAVLVEALHSDHVARFDPDDPACSSALALLDAAENCDAVIAADTSRADLPGVVPMAMPWLTWITQPAAIPPGASAGPADALVVADPAWRERAIQAGWPAERVGAGGWPLPTEVPPASTRTLAVVADIRPVVPPEHLSEFSSHQLLWDQIEAQLAADPFSLGESPRAYLKQRMRRHGVSGEGFDATLFLEHLVLPAYEQAIVRLLLREGLQLRLFGAGWQDIGEFTAHAAGAVKSRFELAQICRQAIALVHVWPGMDLRPLHRLGRPVVKQHGAMGRRQFIESARRALTGEAAQPPRWEPVSLGHFLALLSD